MSDDEAAGVTDLHDGDDASAEIAERVGVTVDVLAVALGGGWKRLKPAPSRDAPSADQRVAPEASTARRFVTGDPPQVMLLVEDDLISIGAPACHWYDWAWCTYELAEPQITLSIVEPNLLPRLADVADKATMARRRRFQYCRYCRALTPPEYRDEPRVCMSCSERYLGVVH